jgi:hypothetical protein
MNTNKLFVPYNIIAKMENNHFVNDNSTLSTKLYIDAVFHNNTIILLRS